MTRIEQEKRIVRKMIELYCRHHLHQDTMPDEYLHLADFACRRLQVLLQRESYGLYYSDWLRPVNMEVLQFLVLRATSG